MIVISLIGEGTGGSKVIDAWIILWDVFANIFRLILHDSITCTSLLRLNVEQPLKIFIVLSQWFDCCLRINFTQKLLVLLQWGFNRQRLGLPLIIRLYHLEMVSLLTFIQSLVSRLVLIFGGFLFNKDLLGNFLPCLTSISSQWLAYSIVFVEIFTPLRGFLHLAAFGLFIWLEFLMDSLVPWDEDVGLTGVGLGILMVELSQLISHDCYLVKGVLVFLLSSTIDLILCLHAETLWLDYTINMG